MRRWLKPLRLAFALVVLGGFVAAFVDFRGLVPASLAGSLAAVQFGPALLAAAGGSGAAAVILAALLVLTLLVGRLYCSVLCPLGLLQDAVNRLAARWRRRPLRYTPANAWLRYGVLAAVVAAVVAGAGGVVAAWLDPYSGFGRIASTLARPLLVALNNLLVPAAHSIGSTALYRVPVPLAAAGVVAFALAGFALVAGLAAWRGRLFCNSICPVGTLLGVFAKFGVYRLAIDRDACTKCAQCLRSCKAQCIDLRTGHIDASRCVACYNCIGACDHSGIGYRLAWSHGHPAAPTVPPDSQRRALIAGALLAGPAAALRAADAMNSSAAPAPVAPPGAGSVARLLDRCTACQLCVSACPTQVLQPALFHYGWAGFAKPRLDFERSFCNFECRTCGEVCPTDAISLLALADKKLTSVGVAKFDRALCIVETDGTDCAACSEHCPTKAVDTVPFRDNLRLPQVKEELCIGCGACEFACPVRPKRAIAVAARAEHVRAHQAEDAKPDLPKPAGDFPF